MGISRKLLILSLFILAAAPRAVWSQELSDRVAIGIRLFEAGKLREAREVLVVADRENPKDARVAYYLGRITFAERDYGKAADWFEKATKADGENAHYHFWVGQAHGSAASTANSIRQAILARRIKSAFERAVELDPSYADARFGLMQFYLQAPGVMGGSKEKARAEAGAIQQLDPWLGYQARVQIHQLDRDTAAYEAEHQKALVVFPDSSQPYLSLGFLYQQRSEYERAFEAFGQLLVRHPDALDALYQVGRLAALSGQRLAQGEAALREYLRHEPGPQNPRPAAAHWRLGMIHEHQGQPDLARREYETALELDPDLKEAREALRNLGK